MPAAAKPSTVRSDCTKVSSGMATKTRANGSMKPRPICAAVVIHTNSDANAAPLSPRSTALVASVS